MRENENQNEITVNEWSAESHLTANGNRLLYYAPDHSLDCSNTGRTQVIGKHHGDIFSHMGN